MPTVYVTVPPDAAEDVASTLVEERLAACVNRVPCQSVYRWDDEIHRDEEVILLAKTTADAADTVTRRVAEIHPYDVPCIELFEEDEVAGPFAAWRTDAVSPPAEDD